MALYLKYRPQDFKSLVWQTFIKQTLQTAISQDKTVWAYLFTGPRGTGKTSTARIFAKAINCLNPVDGNPCLSCDMCRAFADNALIDVIEIDAASHTGVDNIREIIEKAQFQPSSTKYKIYIIDEVHMLSKGAFNALLKILEEPPAHIKFILATTEIQKVPETILSRCQRYDFKNFSNEDLLSQLKYIAGEEWVEVDDKSYTYIIQSAEGGMRNAVSLFEQLISSDKTISFSTLSEELWLTSQDEKENFLKKLILRDSTVISDFKLLLEAGKDVKTFLKSVTQLLQATCIADLQAGRDISREIEILDTLQKTLTQTKNSFDETLVLQIGLMKIINIPSVNNMHSWLSLTQQTTIAQKVIAENKNTQTQESQKPVKEASVNIPKPILENTSSLIEEAQNIFASDEPYQELWGQKTLEQSFDTEKFISQVKIQGAKAAVSMSMRWSDLRIESSVLGIYPKTKVSRETLSKSENKEYMFQASDALSLGITKIEIH